MQILILFGIKLFLFKFLIDFLNSHLHFQLVYCSSETNKQAKKLTCFVQICVEHKNINFAEPNIPNSQEKEIKI